MTQCLALSLLSSIVKTLGPAGPSGAAFNERRDGGSGRGTVGVGVGGRGASLGGLSEDERLMKELQGSQVCPKHTYGTTEVRF